LEVSARTEFSTIMVFTVLLRRSGLETV
jgi:hypothetical protein